MSEDKLGIGSQVRHTHFGEGVIVEVNLGTYTVWFKNRGEKDIPHADERLTVAELVEDEVNRITLEEVKFALKDVLESYSDISPDIEGLGNKWVGGTMSLQPANENLKAKEIPIEAFFHKIVMTRDRLRVMEQKINASKGLNDEEKVALQQYITRIYGSLTTFNVLFDSPDGHFKGTGS